MGFPLNKSLRSKVVDVNKKKIKIIPWSNIQLAEYESYTDNNKDVYSHDAVYEILIKNNIEYTKKLSLLDEHILLIELYKISKSSTIDLVYTCKHCEVTGVNCNINIDKTTSYRGLVERSIKTTNYDFELRPNSSYRIDASKDMNLEAIRYFASYVTEFTYKKVVYPITDLEEFVEYIINELPSTDFDSLMNNFNKIKPDVIVLAPVICEHCGKSQDLTFKIIDFLD